MGTHATGIRAAVVVEQAFVVLAGGERQRELAVTDGGEGHLFADQELFHHHPFAGAAETALGEKNLEGGVEFFLVFGDQHPFARGQTVGLEHHREAKTGGDFAGATFVVGNAEIGRRDVVPAHELFGVDLAAFQLGGLAFRPENGEAATSELVGDAEGQGQLGTHHREVDLEVGGKIRQLVDFVRRNRHQIGDLGDAGIAGRAVQLGDLRALAQFPAERVFSAA